MKYQLLWTACVIGLLQLSVVTCRRAHDKVTNKENEEYSTTVSPPVAYTGQEIERALNSSDKLALDPGPMSYDRYPYRDSFDPAVLIICLSTVFAFIVVLTFFCGCILMFLRAKKIRPGLTLNHNLAQSRIEAQNPETSTASRSTDTDSTTQQFPAVFRTVQYAAQPQPVLNYRPLQQPQPMLQYQSPLQDQSHPVPSTSQAVHQASPMQIHIEPSVSVVEFSNPVCSVEDRDEN